MVAEVATIIKVGVRRHLPDYFVIVLASFITPWEFCLRPVTHNECVTAMRPFAKLLWSFDTCLSLMLVAV